MLVVQLDRQPTHFLKRADKRLAQRLLDRLRRLARNPFPRDVKRVLNHRDKVFRVRVGDYRIEYAVYHGEGVLFVFIIEKRPRAYK